ncbi:hypothetical protein MTO96_024136 [Rhipicephalus appendiculatus]
MNASGEPGEASSSALALELDATDGSCESITFDSTTKLKLLPRSTRRDSGDQGGVGNRPPQELARTASKAKVRRIPSLQRRHQLLVKRRAVGCPRGSEQRVLKVRNQAHAAMNLKLMRPTSRLAKSTNAPNCKTRGDDAVANSVSASNRGHRAAPSDGLIQGKANQVTITLKPHLDMFLEFPRSPDSFR